MAKRILPAHTKLHVERHSWGTVVQGTREMLIEHGYVTDGSLPGDPGRNKCTLNTTDAQGRAISIARYSKYRFRLYIRYTDEEKEWYDKREAKKQEAERIARMREQEIQRATELVNSWPKSATAFRQESIKAASCSLTVFQNVVLNGNDGGWRYDDATTQKIERLIDQIFGLIETGGVVEDMALKERNTPACIADVVLASQPKPEPRYNVEGNIIRLGR